MTGQEPLTQPADRFVDAVRVASEIHRTQSRKNTRVPYLTHLLAVASLVLEDGGDEDEAIAGLLHDAVEDGDGSAGDMLGQVRSGFGDRVAVLVAACTDVDIDGDADRSPATWSARKQHTIDGLADADPSAARVMLADKLHNLRSTLTDLAVEGPRVWTRFNAGRDDQLWYYAALADAARANHANSRLAREFVAAVQRLAGSAGIPRNPSDWADTAEVSNPCGEPDSDGANPCRRPAGHRGLHAGSPRPGDL